MLDINYVREHAKLVRENLAKRQDADVLKQFDEVLKLNVEWRELKGKVDELRHRRNVVSQEINVLKKQGKNVNTVIEEIKSLPVTITEIESKSNSLQDKIRNLLLKIPNLLHDSVPFGKDDADNVVVKKFGRLPKFKFKLLGHEDILRKWKLVDLERAAKISGARWYFLREEIALLEMALTKYAIDFMRKKKFALVVPPFMMNRRAYEGVTSLGDFEEMLYKIDGEDLYAIATSEHPCTARFMDEVLPSECLPVKMVGFSTNFRKEAGAHGKDTKGIFRVHQFNKVEQLIICRPEDSWHFHEELIKNAVEFFQSLGLHGRVVNVCTGDIGIVAAKKYDFEAWMPVQNAYREMGSCSNCTTYQAVRLNIKYQDGAERKYVHTLNSTCVATSRAVVAILENFQKEDGTIKIPKVLHKYCGFKMIGKVEKKKKQKNN
ncbi:serine--tRNA ligase [Candidatus Woesearchaeota archaeon]|nr:serine--tRNA ligase [Candidatus Woesearchaeota archaeon]